ncbi:hypothetical protein LAZ67_13000423 [Cordylochernes scorpioides]|uniref:Uncharacterized protein n=1 Tax=Cordylochernes scorpioides TaxID=51811 RepID=A0ABY6L2Y4_9ARAC|nr:hypothetical protein LAZ67_13000423 [Cordylochernes scorpioides]
MEKEKGQLFSLTLDEWTSIRSKRYLNINIHSRTKVWNLGLTRISGVFSSEQCKYVICAKLLEFGIDFETDIVCVTTDGCAMMVKLGHIIGPLQQLCYAHGLHLAVMDVLYDKKKERVVPEFVSATVNEAESDLSEDNNEDTSPFNVSLKVAHPSFPEAMIWASWGQLGKGSGLVVELVLCMKMVEPGQAPQVGGLTTGRGVWVHLGLDLGILGSAWERFRARGGAGALHEDGGARSSTIGRWLDYRKGCLGPSWTEYCEEIVGDYLILKEDNPVTESKMKSQEDTSVKLGGDCENDLSQTEPIQERCVKGGKKKGETKSILEERHKAGLEEQERKLIKEGVRRSQRLMM